MPFFTQLSGIACHTTHVSEPAPPPQQQQQQQQQPSSSVSAVTENNTLLGNRDRSSPSIQKYAYRRCPICSERVLVRIHGALVHKWVNRHFEAHHHEWMTVVVNMHQR